MPSPHDEAISGAIQSELLTYFRLDHIPTSSEARSLRLVLEKKARETYWSLRQLWEETNPAEVFIPNGRTSRQKASRLVAESLGIPVRLYECGRAQSNAYYLGTTQPHDRIASQAEVGELTSTMSRTKMRDDATTWLNSRMSATGGTNAFSASWTPVGVSSVQKTSASRAVFFASSFDEFLAFGPMWTIDEWSSQFEAFDLIMSLLEKRDVEIVLRLHPNLGSKSRKYFLREVTDILELQRRHPSLKIYWHNSSVNSYDLVAGADYVIVERSTIGLEACLMGKPVWVTQATQWDRCADIRQLLKPDDVTESSLALWRPSPLGAQRFVAYWMAQEHPLRFRSEDWASWDPDHAPLSMKFLQLALANSWRHKYRLIALEWNKIVNARFRPPRLRKRER